MSCYIGELLRWRVDHRQVAVVQIDRCPDNGHFLRSKSAYTSRFPKLGRLRLQYSCALGHDMTFALLAS